MRKKQFYEAPEAEMLSVKFERNFCESPVEGNGSFGDTKANPEDLTGESWWGGNN